MAQHANHDRTQDEPHQRRWPMAVAAGAVLLVGYMAAVAWFSTRLGDEIQSSVQHTPVVEDTHHRAE